MKKYLSISLIVSLNTLLLTSCNFLDKYLNINKSQFSSVTSNNQLNNASTSERLTNSQIEELLSENAYNLSALIGLCEAKIVDIDVLIGFLQSKLLENEQQISLLIDELQAIRDEINNSSQSSTSGRDLVFSFPLDNQPYMSDHTFVGEELWFFIVSDDGHAGYSNVLRYNIDFESQSANFIGSFKHNFGHCNSVDYCEETNALIMGNGGGPDNPENNQIFIFPNSNQMKNFDKISLEGNAVIIDLDEIGLDWGMQVNACWGESNGGSYNIAYVSSNDGQTKTIRKLLFGQGCNKLDYGILIKDLKPEEFNGTFNILQTWETPYAYEICTQGTDWYKGRLYEGIGHDGMRHFEHYLGKSGIRTKENQEFFYNNDGSKKSTITEGIALKNGYMIMGNIVDYKVYVYNVN